MITIIRLFWIGAICFSNHSLFAQVRFEQEKRIKERMVPAGAIQALGGCVLPDRVRWYLEISELGKTYEAKFQIDHSRFSVEFDSTGHLLDVECVVPMDSMLESARLAVLDTLKNHFSKFLVEKIQAQYLPSDMELCSFFPRDGTLDIPDHYELVVSGLRKGRLARFEFLFDQQGSLHRVSEIISRPSENLER